MNNNNLVVIERDMHCPYCDTDSAVIISETRKMKSRIGCAAIGCKDGCLLTVTGGCWSIISGIPLYDITSEYQTYKYGFCPHCGNTYPITPPEGLEAKETVGQKFMDTKDGFVNNFNSVKNMFSNGNNNDR